MSKTIDEKVVEMRFDNSHFEKNVQTSLSTLDKLKNSLNLSGASKGLTEISNAANKTDFSGMTGALETVKSKFSAMEIVAITALSNITNKVIDTGLQLVKSLSIDQIAEGWNKYGQKTGSVQTLMNSTGKSLDEINGYLNKLMWYSDETSYGFTDMTAALAQMTTSGGEIENIVPLIMGVANATAYAGKGAAEFSRIMYNLNQSYGAGYLTYMDWRSVELAGGASKQLKQTIIDTAEELGKIEKGEITLGNFSTTLKDKWADTEVMEKAFAKFNDLADAAYKAVEAGEFDTTSEAIAALSDKYSELGTKAFKSAQEAKTFLEAIEATKDAVSSKWMASFEYIFGNYDEAKTMWTDLANELYDIFAASGDVRNEMLKSWKELGGRDDLIQSFKNIYQAVRSFIDPIHEAFRDVFPPMTTERLYNLTKGLKEFTEKLIIGDDKAQKIKETFTGFFKIISAGLNVIKQLGSAIGHVLGNFSGVGNAILSLISNLGVYLSRLADTINGSNTLSNILEGIINTIDKLINKIKDLPSKLSKFEGIFKFFNNISNDLKSLGRSFGEVFRNGGFKQFFDILNAAVVSGSLISLTSFMKNLSNSSKQLKGSLSGLLNGIKGIFDGAKGVLKEVGNVLQAWQQSIKADVIMKIAKAIAIMAASLFLLSMINPERLSSALTAMSASIAEMMVALKLFFVIFPKDASQTKGMYKSLGALLVLSLSLMEFAFTLKSLSSLEWPEIIRGLGAMGGALSEMMLALFVLKKMDLPDLKKSIKSMNDLAWTLLVTSFALKSLASMSWPEIGRGLTVMAGALVELVGASVIMGRFSDKGAKGKGMFGFVMSLLVLSGVLKILGTMSWPDIAKSITVMGLALTELVGASVIMGRFSDKGTKGKGIFGFVLSLLMLSGVLKILSTFSWSEIISSLVLMGLALTELVGASVIISKFVGKGTSASLVGMGFALIELATGLKILSSVNLGSTLLGLVGLAAVLAVLGVAAKLLTPLAPSLLAISASMSLFSLAVVGFGAGLLIISAGITALASALSLGANIIVAGLSTIILGIIQAIPDIAKLAIELIKVLCNGLMECAPLIAETALKLVYEVLKLLANYTPMIIESFAQFIIGIIQGLAKYVPQIIKSLFDLLGSIIESIVNTISELDPSVMLQGIACIGMLTAILIGLSSLSGMIPSAALGILGFGLLVSELAIVVAALGKLSEIKGMKEVVGEGGNFLQQIGIALGQFIGGLVGGIAVGVTAALPIIADNLSEFMINIQGFLDGVETIPDGIVGKVSILSGAILLLSGSSFIAQLLELISVGSNLADLGQRMSDFMINIQPFLAIAATIDPNILEGITVLSEAMLILSHANFMDSLASIVGVFTGSHSLADFGKQIAELGTSLRQFSENLGDFDKGKVDTIGCAGDAVVKLAEAAQKIPNEGGLWALLAGDNSLAQFGSELPDLGKYLKEFVKSLGTFDKKQVDTIQAAGDAILKLANAADKIPNKGGLWNALAGDNSLAQFGDQLPGLASNLSSFIKNLGSFDKPQLETIQCVGDAIVKLAEAAKKIPNEGGLWSSIVGDNSLATFSGYLPGLGTDMSDFIKNLGSFDKPQIETVNAVGEAIVKLAEAAQKIPNEGGLWAKIAGDNSLATFSGYLPGLGSDINSFINNLGTFNEAQVDTVNCVGEAIVKLAEAAQKIPNEGGLWAKIAGDNSLATFSGYLPNLGKDMSSFLKNLGTFDKNQVGTVECAGTAIVKLAEAAKNIPNEGGLWAKIFGENSISTFASKLPSVGSNLKDFSKNLGTFDQKNVDTVDCAGKAVLALSQAASQLPKSGGLTSLFSGDNDLSKFAEKFPPVATHLNNFIKNLGSFSATQVETCKTAVEAMKSLVSMSQLDIKNTGKSLEEFGACAISFSYKLKEFIESMKGVGSNSLQGAIDKTITLIEMAKTLGAQNILGLQVFGTTLKNIAKTGVKGFVEAFTSMEPRTQVENGINNIINSLLNAAERKRWEITNKFKTIGQDAVNALNDWNLVNQAENAGKNLVQGFARGINNNSYLARNAGSSVGTAALNAAKQAIDAHSPSREAEKLGVFFDQGLVNGIMKFSNNVYTAANDVGITAKDGLSNAISKIRDTINSDMDTNPVIRPVLDLDGVSSGLNSMNSMFGRPNLSVASNLGAISSNFAKRNQNGNQDVVSAIEKLKDGLNNISGNTYNVNGVSYDDGSNVSDAVRTLIRAAKIERRK